MTRKEETNNNYIIIILYSGKTHVTSSLLFDQFISNIQEIIDIEWLFELICMFSFVFLSSLQIIRKRGNNSKTRENSELLLYYCAIVKYILCILNIQKYIFFFIS